MVWVPGLEARHVPPGDAVLAATWRTAEHVTALPPASGRKFYLIQLWETGTGPDERVVGAWKLPLTKIVIARRYLEIAHRLGETAVYVPNGLDTVTFGIDTPPEARDPARIAMLYHRAVYKGSADGLAALRLARTERPDLTADLYGVPPAPPDLPDWISYHRRVLGADLRRLLNRACIFVSPSRNEGWGLPPCEAQLCGCVLAITDNDGHREFAVDGETALLSPIGDPAALAANIVRLIDDAGLRRRLTAAGLEKLGHFDWERSCDALEAELKGDTTPRLPSMGRSSAFP